eukprot:1900780-Pyramimonas_sp.AAC.1
MPTHIPAHARTCGACVSIADRSMAHTRTCVESCARTCSHMPMDMHAHARTCGTCAELADRSVAHAHTACPPLRMTARPRTCTHMR